MSAHPTTAGTKWLAALMVAPNEAASVVQRPIVAWLVMTLRWFAFLAGVSLANAAVWDDGWPGSPRTVAGVNLAIAVVLASVAVSLARRSRRSATHDRPTSRLS